MSFIDPIRKRSYNRKYYERKKKAPEAKERKLLLQVRVPETLAMQLHRLVLDALANGTYPWKTLAEAVTMLLKAGLEQYKGTDLVDELLPELEHQAHVQKFKTSRRSAMTMLNSAREEISELMGIGQEQEAATCYHMTLESARNMPATVWAEWMISELEKAFPKLRGMQAKGVNLEHTLRRRADDPPVRVPKLVKGRRR